MQRFWFSLFTSGHGLSLLLSAVLFGCTIENQSNQTPTSTIEHAFLPYLTTSPDRSELFLSWVESRDDSSYFYFSRWQQDGWSYKTLISKGNNWFVNWADYPMIAVNDDRSMQAHFLQKNDSGTYTYDVILLRSSDGQIWQNTGPIHDDRTSTEHGFVSHIPSPDGGFQVAWLDGRNTIQTAEHHGHGSAAMTLRTAYLTPDGEIINRRLLDASTCDCCQTSGACIEKGPIIVYRDRSELEIRDIYITRLVDSVWTAPQAIFEDQWHIEGCPVNGPRASYNDGVLGVAWYTAAQGKPKVKVSFSRNGGEQFDLPYELDTDGPLGRVDIEVINSSTAYISWLSKSGDIHLATVDPSKGKLSSQVLAKTNTERSSGFPQISFIEGRLVCVWTVKNQDGFSIHTTVLSL